MVALIPMIFPIFMTLFAMFQQVVFEWSWMGTGSNMLLFVLGSIIFVFAIWIALTSFSELMKKVEDPLNKD